MKHAQNEMIIHQTVRLYFKSPVLLKSHLSITTMNDILFSLEWFQEELHTSVYRDMKQVILQQDVRKSLLL